MGRNAQETLAPYLGPGLTWDGIKDILISEFGSAQDIHTLKTKFVSLKLGKA